MADSQSDVITVVSQPFAQNTYIAYVPGRTDCVVFDPGLEPDKILGVLDDHHLVPSAILCTHGHLDHVAGNSALKSRWPECPLVIGVGDADKLTDPVGNLSAGYGLPMVSPPADAKVREGDVYETAGLRLLVFETPGHSRGHVTFVDRQSTPVRIFSGDVLFERGIGRYDFPDANFEQLRASIHEKLFAEPNDAIVYTGHGSTTTIGAEKKYNPFVGAAAGYDV